MRVAIIGAGFTGLSSAYQLAKSGHEVILFEKESYEGGLAIGFVKKQWQWTLEKHYHHWFTNDYTVLHLAKELNHEVIIKRPKTSVYLDNSLYQLDSPLHLLLFPKLPLISRLRMAAVLGFLRFNPFWQQFEHIKVADFLSKTMGQEAYETIWEPQLKNKFGIFAKDISLAWFWARIKKRTQSLSYPEGGFLSFAKHLVQEIEKNTGKVIFDTEIVSLFENTDKTVTITRKTSDASPAGEIKKETFDKVIVTLPSFLFLKIAPQLPTDYKNKLLKLKGLGATNLVLRLKKPFFSDNTYWLSIADTTSPIMAIVEHTNFMNKKYYNNEHIVYLGNYLAFDDKQFLMDKEQLLRLFDPFLRKINPTYHKYLIGYELFKAPFAQPIIPTNYSKLIPSFVTPLENVYLANIEQVYPWDRGTNYAVELGEKIARLITE